MKLWKIHVQGNQDKCRACLLYVQSDTIWSHYSSWMSCSGTAQLVVSCCPVQRCWNWISRRLCNMLDVYRKSGLQVQSSFSGKNKKTCTCHKDVMQDLSGVPLMLMKRWILKLTESAFVLFTVYRTTCRTKHSFI